MKTLLDLIFGSNLSLLEIQCEGCTSIVSIENMRIRDREIPRMVKLAHQVFQHGESCSLSRTKLTVKR